jgi:hypothetical protein
MLGERMFVRVEVGDTPRIIEDRWHCHDGGCWFFDGEAPELTRPFVPQRYVWMKRRCVSH